MMYWDIWGNTPADSLCNVTRGWVGCMAITCWFEAHLCLGMAYGCYCDSNFLFWLYFLLHLVGGAAYTFCTIGIPLARFSDKGEDCAALDDVNGDRLAVVWYTHVGTYLVYVGSMLTILYFSFLKPTFFKATKPSTIAGEGDL